MTPRHRLHAGDALHPFWHHAGKNKNGCQHTRWPVGIDRQATAVAGVMIFSCSHRVCAPTQYGPQSLL
jgi:hypothetical protein